MGTTLVLEFVFAFPVAGLQRVGLAALLAIPFLVVVLVVPPALVVGLMLSEKPRKETRALLRPLIDWSKVIAGSAQQSLQQVGTSGPRSVPRISGQ